MTMQIETKLGVFSPETVIQAYVKLGYKPDPWTYHDPENKRACALGVFVEANAPGAMETARKADPYKSHWNNYGKILEISPEDFKAISVGFFGGMQDHDSMYALGTACREAVDSHFKPID